MKKAILSLILMLTTLCSFGQISVTYSGTKIQKVATLRSTYLFLGKASRGYCIYASSDNRFDECYNCIYLGKTAEEVAQSVEGLLSLLDSGNDFASIQDATDTEITLRFTKFLGTRVCNYKMHGNAGESNFTPKELKKALKWVQENN